MDQSTTAGFSADTEILTQRGWLPISGVADADEVATRSLAGTFRWQVPTGRRCGQYDGEMIHFGGRSLDLLVTPDHFMLWTRYGGKRAREACNWAWSIEGLDAACLVGTSTYDAPDLEGITFRATARATKGPAPREITMTGDQYAAFMGAWLAEGCAFPVPNDWRICISQSRAGKGYDEYRDLLTDIFGKEPMRNSENWVMSSRALYDHLAPLGKAKDKHIPAEILEMSRRQLQIFWDFYFLGDGSYAYDQQIMATASPQMAGQLQEIIQKLGWSASVRREQMAANHLVKTSNLIFKLGVRKTAYPEYKNSRIPYAGPVYGVAVPSETIYVRRNGRAVWAIG